jgi:hypothetical protein
MGDILRVGGIQYSWNSTLTRVDGQAYRGFTSIDWGEQLDVETVRSQTQDGIPMGGTGGEYSVNAFTIKMLWEYWEGYLKPYLAFLAPGYPVGNRGALGSYGQTAVQFQLTASEAFQVGALPIALEASPMRFISAKQTVAKGNAALEAEIACWVQQMSINGITLYSAAPPSL